MNVQMKKGRSSKQARISLPSSQDFVGNLKGSQILTCKMPVHLFRRVVLFWDFHKGDTIFLKGEIRNNWIPQLFLRQILKVGQKGPDADTPVHKYV